MAFRRKAGDKAVATLPARHVGQLLSVRTLGESEKESASEGTRQYRSAYLLLNKFELLRLHVVLTAAVTTPGSLGNSAHAPRAKHDNHEVALHAYVVDLLNIQLRILRFLGSPATIL